MTEIDVLKIAFNHFKETKNEQAVVKEIFPNLEELGGKEILEALLNQHFTFFESIAPRGGSYYIFYLTPECYKSVALYGADEYFKEILEEEKKKSEIADLNFKKLKYDVKISERIYNTYFSTRTMAIIACAVSVCLLVLKLAELLRIWPYR